MQIVELLDSLETPAFVYDEREVGRVLDIAESLRFTTGARVLYSLKPLCLPTLLEFMAPQLDGFAVSSPFEARLARSVLSDLSDPGSIHFTSPGIRLHDANDLASLCNYVSFNSLSQWQGLGQEFLIRAECGLRVNPGLSFLDDERYNPCRANSKLGVPLDELARIEANTATRLEGLRGLLVHSNCESTDFAELERTVSHLADCIPGILRRMAWINLGGGYLFPDGANLEPLRRAIRMLRQDFGLEVFLEPGAAFVRAAGYIVATVLDVFASNGKRVAVLDTTVNHMPETLEFDFEPDVLGHVEGGEWDYILAGCTCLAGDLFGEYSFAGPLKTGDRVVFHNAGAYTMTKAHMFNGVNLPSIYALDQSGKLSLVRHFSYQDYALRWGAYAGSPV